MKNDNPYVTTYEENLNIIDGSNFFLPFSNGMLVFIETLDDVNKQVDALINQQYLLAEVIPKEKFTTQMMGMVSVLRKQNKDFTPIAVITTVRIKLYAVC